MTEQSNPSNATTAATAATAATTDQRSQEPEKVVLDAETYAALLDRLDELETKSLRNSAEEPDEEPKSEIDELAAGAKPQQQSQRPLDLNRLSNEQLAKYIAQELTSDVINPVMVKLSQLELRMEERELRDKYNDFNDYKKDIYSILHKNPSLTLEQGYHLAKSQSNKKSDSKNESPTSNSEDSKVQAKKDLLRHLPKRPASYGEKPSGAAAGAVKPATPKDVRSAASRAIEDLEIDFPVKGGNI